MITRRDIEIASGQGLDELAYEYRLERHGAHGGDESDDSLRLRLLKAFTLCAERGHA